MQSPKELDEFKKVEQKVEELSQALQEAADAGLNITVIQRQERYWLPDGKEWPYGKIDLPEMTIQGFGYTHPSEEK